MAVDPLSPATRVTKRNLLVASVLAITYRAFDVSIDKIPVAGLSISFDNRVFAFLLIATLLYLTTTFALYYFIDIRNLERTPHRTAKEQSYRESRDMFWQSYPRKIMKRIQRALPEDIEINVNEASSLASVFQAMQAPKFDADQLQYIIPKNFMVYKKGLSTKQVSRDEEKEAYAIIDSIVEPTIRSYLRTRAWHNRRIAVSLYGVRLLYLVRDYFVDGILPLVLALVAFAALFHFIDLQWLRNLMPTPPG